MDVNPLVDADVSEAAAQIGDAENAMEALRLVGLTIQDLDRSRLQYGHGGPQTAQIEAMMYLVHQVHRHIKDARCAADRAEQVLTSTEASAPAE